MFSPLFFSPQVLPTDDPERHTDGKKFAALLKFAKEVQVRQRREG